MIFFTFFSLAASFTVIAQDNSKIDSLRSVLPGQSASDQYGTLIALGLAFVDQDNKQSLEYIDHAYAVALEVGDTAKIVKSGRIKGQLLRRVNRPAEALEVLQRMRPIAKRNELISDYKTILNSLAVTYAEHGEYHKALDYHFMSLDLREREGNKGEISVSLDNIGFVYYKLSDYTKAIEYFERSLQLKKESGGDHALYITLGNLGYCHVGLQYLEEAREYFEKALLECAKKNCPGNFQIDFEHGLGTSYLLSNDLAKATTHLTRSYKMAVEADDKKFQAENLILFAQMHIARLEHDSAVIKLTNAEQFSEASGYTESLIDTYRLFSILYKKQENFEKASYYQDKYIALKDSVFSQGLIKNIASVQTKLEQRENIKKIANRDEELARQRTLNIAFIIIAALASLLVFMLFKSNVTRRRANERLDREVKVATADLQAANQLLAEVNQELDHFIYKTSHDIRGPLATLKGLCNVALSDVNDPDALKYLHKLDITATQLDSLLRRLQKINQINNAPMHAQPIDFREIIAYVELLERRKGLPPRISLRYDVSENITLSSDRELVTLILENLIANAVKFHNTSERVDPFVHVAIRRDLHELIIEVTDNGIGIGGVNPEDLFHIFARASERSVSGGIGLYLSRRATQKLGGKINMHTTPEGYTKVVVTLPVNEDGSSPGMESGQMPVSSTGVENFTL